MKEGFSGFEFLFLGQFFTPLFSVKSITRLVNIAGFRMWKRKVRTVDRGKVIAKTWRQKLCNVPSVSLPFVTANYWKHVY